MNKKPYIHKRLIAYVIDIFIVAMISSIIIMPFSKNEEYTKKSNELYEVIEEFKNKEITEDKYLEQVNNINYELTKINVNQTIVIVIVSSLYFVLFNYYNKGQTLGKKLMKLRIVSIDDSKLSINGYVIRTLVGGTVLSNLVTVILVLTLSKENYLIYEDKLSLVFSVIYLLCFIFALYRNDGRGLHDLLAGTIVINDKKENEIQEADIVNEQINKEEEVK